MKWPRALAACIVGISLTGCVHGDPAPWVGPEPTADEAKLVELFGQAAAQGNAAAMANLGYMHERGLGGLTRNETEAVRLYRAAAEHGNALALTNLAVMVAGGRGVPQDDGEAVRLLRLASRQGDVRAQTYLAALYVVGRGSIAPADTEALNCLRATAERGEIWALRRMAALYEQGAFGVPKDLDAAIRLNQRMAVEWGSAEAKAHLGALYEQRRARDAVNR